MTDLFKEYIPIVYKLENNNKKNILDTSNDILFSNNIAYPKLHLGFHHFIFQTKDVVGEKINLFENRKKVYLVTSLFEKNIDSKKNDEDNSINTSLKTFIQKNIVKKNDYVNILSRAFLKLWEIIILFDLIPEKENFVSSHLAEGPGSFIQATILYRDLQENLKKIKSSKNDKYYGISLHSDNKHLLIEKEFINYYDKEKPKRLHIFETVSKEEVKKGGDISSDSVLSDGDLTRLKTINMFAGGVATNTKGFSEDSDLVTADGGFKWEKENLQEQEAYKLIFSQIVTALKLNKKGGNFVLKIFDTYTIITLKYLEILKSLYKDVYITKPFSSRISNSEKYVVCKNLINKVSSSDIKKLEEMITLINKNDNYNMIDVFSDYDINDKSIQLYKKINIELFNKQYIGMTNILTFVNLDNYNGVEYHNYLDKQIAASIYWNNTFLDPKNYNDIHKFISFHNKEQKLEEKQEVDKADEAKKSSKKQSRTKAVNKLKSTEKSIDYKQQLKNNLS
jgi:23S rRNA U2552 (ribose-2'-O)-methylase RlmE/FtsJ